MKGRAPTASPASRKKGKPDEQTPEGKRNDRIAYLEALDPEELTIGQVLADYQNFKAYQLETLILIDRIEAASFGWSVAVTLSAFEESKECVQFPECQIEPKKIEPVGVQVTVGDMVRMMQLSLVPAFPDISAAIDSWKALVGVKTAGCIQLGHGQLAATEFVQLCEPLAKRRGARASIVSLLPLIDALHDKPTLRGLAEGLEEAQGRFTQWLQTHKGVYESLDPHFVLVVPAGTAVAGMAGFVAALPALPGGPLAPHLDSVGNATPWLLSAPTAGGMMMAAAALRAQLAHPAAPAVGAIAAVGGGAGPGSVVAFFSTAPGTIGVL